MVNLSQGAREKIHKLFPAEQQHDVASLLINECGNNLPLCENLDANQLDRIRFAVLKISNGNLSELKRAVDWAKLDWRDVLMEAGFGYSVIAHREWLI